ncbi:helix-turn-helix transcriptional regulator [Oceanobacillus caeni]|uniref:helix-turn-helix transcriptional regulator n=1 Tax=Virgibacillus sp. SK37 TaxID=403957 RepID=UPI0011A6F69D|nr:helix-turn-helix transcriptional regulator [Virgibacillus sp. SK37]
MKNNINYWIEKSGYKKKWIAKELGVSNEVLSRWVNNKSKPSVENLFKLAALLGCKVDDLYTLED